MLGLAQSTPFLRWKMERRSVECALFTRKLRVRPGSKNTALCVVWSSAWLSLCATSNSPLCAHPPHRIRVHHPPAQPGSCCFCRIPSLGCLLNRLQRTTSTGLSFHVSIHGSRVFMVKQCYACKYNRRGKLGITSFSSRDM